MSSPKEILAGIRASSPGAAGRIEADLAEVQDGAHGLRAMDALDPVMVDEEFAAIKQDASDLRKRIVAWLEKVRT